MTFPLCDDTEHCILTNHYITLHYIRKLLIVA